MVVRLPQHVFPRRQGHVSEARDEIRLRQCPVSGISRGGGSMREEGVEARYQSRAEGKNGAKARLRQEISVLLALVVALKALGQSRQDQGDVDRALLLRLQPALHPVLPGGSLLLPPTFFLLLLLLGDFPVVNGKNAGGHRGGGRDGEKT